MSNEFVMVPREWVETTVAAGAGEVVVLSDIETLAECLSQPHQGEPVAWRYKTRVYVQALGYVWREVIEGEAPNLNEVAARDLMPLYTHADPAEVRVTKQALESLKGEANALRAQLAERDALLVDIRLGGLDDERCARVDLLLSSGAYANAINKHPLLRTSSDNAAIEAALSASAEPSAPKFSDNWTPPDTIKIQITAEEMKRLGLKDPAAPKYCGKVKVVYGHGDYGRCGSDERSPGIPAQCDDCKNAKVVDMPTIVINDDEQMPDIVYDSCQFIGRNADGSEPFTFGTTADGRRTITKIDFRGWKCYGPMQDEPSAPVERDDLRIHLEAMCKLWPEDLSDDGSGRMGFKSEVAATVAKARAALERKPS